MSSIDVYIVAAVRTPIGSFTGSYGRTPASDLGSAVIQELLKRSGVQPEDVDEVIMGQALAAGQGQNPARQAALKAGLSLNTSAYGINMLCGSGLKTVVLGYQAIRAGDSSIVIAGGQENMSLAPHVLHLRQGVKLGSATLLDTMIHDGLTDAFHNIHMGKTAENLASKYNVSRSAQDVFALESQKRASFAQNNGYFDEEIVPFDIVTPRGTTRLERDEYIKHNATLESLNKLKPVFDENGSVTAGNASGLNDAAAGIMLMSSEALQNHGHLKPLARIVGWAQTGCKPELMGIGCAGAVSCLLKKICWTKDEVDLYELNEAFAAQALSVLQELDVDDSKVNVHGGAIALGHPIGASGARVLVTLLYALQRTGGKKGIASLCIGGGMGIAIAVERIE